MNGGEIVGKHVEWFYAPSRDHAEGKGQVVAFSDQPMVCIENVDGEQLWWNLSLSRVIPCECFCHTSDIVARSSDGGNG